MFVVYLIPSMNGRHYPIVKLKKTLISYSPLMGVILWRYRVVYQKQLRMKNSYLKPYADLIFLTQISQYLSITVACSTLKQAVCVATLPQYTQNFIFLSDSFVKPSTYCNVFTSMSPRLIVLYLHIVNSEFSKNYYHHIMLSNVI